MLVGTRQQAPLAWLLHAEPLPTLHAEPASQPQVHDVLGMRLNRITLHDNEAAPALPGAAVAKKSYEVDDGAD